MTHSLNMVMREDEKFKFSHLHIRKTLMHINNAFSKSWGPLGIQEVL
jgi:hypothetical protein